MDHNVALIVEKELDKAQIRAWLSTVREKVAGITTTVDAGGRPIQIVKSQNGDEIRYAIPLSRDLNETEVQSIVSAFASEITSDYRVAASMSPMFPKLATDIEVDHDPMIALCTGWAKSKHENWMKDKVGLGWRFGPTVCKTSKTHPLLRQWDEIPAQHRRVDTRQAQELLDLLRDSGYLIIRKDDLDRLIGGDDL